MRIISNKSDYEKIHSIVSEIINESKKIPENIYKEKFSYFLFLTFDEIFTSSFFNSLVKYVKGTGRSGFLVVCMDPDPELYYGSNFDFFGAIDFSADDTVSEYISGINNYPENSVADALSSNGNALLYSSVDAGWSIYADRDCDIAICSFLSQGDMNNFQLAFGSDLFKNVESAANYAFDSANNKNIIEIFCQQYKSKPQC